MWATSKTHATQWNELIQNFTSLECVWKVSYLVRYLSIPKHKLAAKAVPHSPIPGLYSGIFMMYLQHCRSQQSTNRGKNILFYALWALYALSTATGIIDILLFFWSDTVSMDVYRCLTLFQSVLQNLEVVYHLLIIEVILFAFCDVISQSILVRPTGNGYHYSFNSSKDISLLDYLGLQHSCGDHSVILSIRILRSIDLSSFTDEF